MNTTLTLKDILELVPRTRGNSNKWPGIRLKVGFSDVRMILSCDGMYAEIYGLRGANARTCYATIRLSDGFARLCDTGRKYQIVSDRNLQIVAAIWHNPVQYLDAHGKANMLCCFCGCNLTHKNSTVRGYGPDCAKRYGLPYGN